MSKSIKELIIGNSDEKRAYRQLMKRVNSLPKDYRFAFKKMQHYMYHLDLAGRWMAVFTDLVDLLEANAAQGNPVLQITGSDISGFCEEFVHASTVDVTTMREKFNQEILDHFHRKGK